MPMAVSWTTHARVQQPGGHTDCPEEAVVDTNRPAMGLVLAFEHEVISMAVVVPVNHGARAVVELCDVWLLDFYCDALGAAFQLPPPCPTAHGALQDAGGGGDKVPSLAVDPHQSPRDGSTLD
jgi:hypothetical protein